MCSSQCSLYKHLTEFRIYRCYYWTSNLLLFLLDLSVASVSSPEFGWNSQQVIEGKSASSSRGSAFASRDPFFNEVVRQQHPSSALKEHLDLSFSSVDSCPVTLIYDLPEFWDFHLPLGSLSDVSMMNIDANCTPNIRHTNAESDVVRILHRLQVSERCTTTRDPHKADLFMVPFFPKPKKLREFCKGFTVRDLESHLPFLDNETAHKHFIFLPKLHQGYDSCGNWWKRPTGLLRRVIRLAHSLPWRGRGRSHGPPRANVKMLDTLARGTGDFLSDSTVYPHLYSVPYPASGYLQSISPPVQQAAALHRPFLIHFGGGLHGDYGLELRKKFVADCRNAAKYQCLLHNFSVKKNTCSALQGKTASKFCFEPGGDTPGRKSLYDSIALGCVPVLTSPYQLLLAPWHLGHFRNTATVYLDRDVYLHDGFDIFTHLENIVAIGEYKRMQEELVANAHSVQYALEDVPGDAVERLLVGVKRASQRYEEQMKQQHISPISA